MAEPKAVNFPTIVEQTYAELHRDGRLKSISQSDVRLLAEILWNNRFDGDIGAFERAVAEVLKAKVNLS